MEYINCLFSRCKQSRVEQSFTRDGNTLSRCTANPVVIWNCVIFCVNVTAKNTSQFQIYNFFCSTYRSTVRTSVCACARACVRVCVLHAVLHVSFHGDRCENCDSICSLDACVLAEQEPWQLTHLTVLAVKDKK